MDQRVKGGTPPATASSLDPACPPEDSKQEKVTEKKRGRDVDMGKKEEGDKGAVLELLIEGRCGGAGQQELQISGRETSCSDANVRVRIGLQAKRTKKPPKILESYVCKPTIRTYQRQGRGALLRAVQESKNISEQANREKHVDLDAVQAPTKKRACSSPPRAKSLSSLSSAPSSALTLDSVPSSVPNPSSQETKTAKQVLIKLADKTEENLNGSSEKVRKDKLPSVNGQSVPAETTTEQTASASPSTTCNQAVSSLESRNDGNCSKKNNGLVQAAKQKELSNGKSSANIPGTSASSKNKAGKHTVPSADSSARPTVSSGTQKELSSKNGPDCPSPKSQSLPTVDLSFFQSQGQGQSAHPPLERKKDKDRKAKKDKRKDKKSKRERLEAERAKIERKKKETKKKRKKEEGKSKENLEEDQKQKNYDPWADELKNEKESIDKRAKLSHDRQNAEDSVKCDEATGVSKPEKGCKTATSARLDGKERMADSCRQAKQVEPVTKTGDSSISTEPDNLRHSVVPPQHSAPPVIPPPSAHAPISPPSSPREQDSRPLKKRKARRPSWTKLVHRAHRVENQEASLDSLHNPSLNFPLINKTPCPPKTTVHQSDESQPSPSGSLSSCSSPLSSAVKPPVPKQSSRFPVNASRKRGRPKSHSSILDEPPPRLSPKDIPNDILGRDRAQKAPVLEPILQCNSSPKKRGRPPKRPLPEDNFEDSLNPRHSDLRKDFRPSEKGNRQLKIRRLINEMKKRKKRRFHRVIMSGYFGKEGADGKNTLRMYKSIDATTVHTLSALSSSFGTKLGPQINVSKRGTIYMGKRRGRKPKSQTASLNSFSQNSHQASLFTNPSEASLFSSNQPLLPPSHPFPSPSLTHSSGAQSPYSEGSHTEPSSSLLFSHHFSLPSPSSSCTSPRPPSSSSVSPFVKKSCPCQGRHQFPFHQSSCKLSGTTSLGHHIPGSPGQLKEATPSPRSESHSDETLPSDSGIGTDNNSVSERRELRGARGILRLGQGSGVMLSGQRLPSSLVERSAPASSPLSHMPRSLNGLNSQNIAERHKDRHRHKRRDCPSSCTCSCSCPGHKCTPSDYYSCLGHNALKRPKNKHKKKHQQLQMQDPEFLAELEDLIAQLNDIHIGRRSWTRTGLGQSFDGSGGGRRHLPSSQSLRSNIFRINLNGFYSPHPSTFPPAPSYANQPYYPCHCNRKLDRRHCGCPSKFQETIESMGFYGSYPPALYHHLPSSSFPLPPPHQYTAHHPHQAHFLLNPARFHRRRNRLLREGAFGGEVEGDLGGGGTSGFTSGLSCGWGRGEHRHKHRHRHCERNVDDEEDLHEEEEDGMEREVLAGPKTKTGFVFGQLEGGRKGGKGVGSMLSKESPWLRQNGNLPFSSASAPSSSSSLAERYRNTPLTSLGLGSSHLSSFGGGWGGLGQNWMTFGNLGNSGFGKTKPTWRGFSGTPPTSRLDASEDEDEGDDIDETNLYGTSLSSKHTNLFASAAVATSGRGLRSGLARDRPWRDEPAWTDRREAGLQGDSRSRGHQRNVPTPDCVEVKSKRGPGRPRKHPQLSPTCSTSPPSLSTPSLTPGDGRGEDIWEERRGRITELESLARGKRARQRKHGDSPCCRSFSSDRPDCDTHSDFLSHSDTEPIPSESATLQREEKIDSPPWKTYLRAGLYSDDYKTTDPPSETQKNCGQSLEYSPGEKDYSLLPAPIHVGKYLRLKRIHFQLPYDVMWLWQHNQLQRQPAVPLKRKRRYCRLKQRAASSQRTEEDSRELTSLFPHLDMEPLSSSERSFVVKHHVFLMRNWELVRDRQIRMRIEREQERDEDEDPPHMFCDDVSRDDGHFKSDHTVGAEVTVISSDLHHQSLDTSSSHSANSSPTKTQNRQQDEEEEEGEEIKRGEREVCSREQRRKRLNDLLLTLQQS